MNQKIKKIVIVLRMSMGVIFFWAFLDKLFGLGFATASDDSWISGQSPTQQFLLFGTHGPFAPMFQLLAGQLWVDWLFMAGLLCIGIALLLGIAQRIATWSGTILLFLMWLSLFPPKNNPIIDEHIIYIFVLWLVYYLDRKKYVG